MIIGGIITALIVGMVVFTLIASVVSGDDGATSAASIVRGHLTPRQSEAMRSIKCESASTNGYECVVRFRGYSDDDNAQFYVDVSTRKLYRHR